WSAHGRFQNEINGQDRGVENGQVEDVSGNDRREEVVNDRTGDRPCKTRGEVGALEYANVRNEIEEESEIYPGIDETERTGGVGKEPGRVEIENYPRQCEDDEESRVKCSTTSGRPRAWCF